MGLDGLWHERVQCVDLVGDTAGVVVAPSRRGFEVRERRLGISERGIETRGACGLGVFEDRGVGGEGVEEVEGAREGGVDGGLVGCEGGGSGWGDERGNVALWVECQLLSRAARCGEE